MEKPTLALQQYVHEEIGSAVMQLRREILEQQMQQLNATFEPSKLDKIERYLHVLYEAQKANHSVHEEIAEALKQFKQEAGI